MSCERVEDLLPSYLDGEASTAEEALVERHLAGCPACRALFRNIRRVDDMVATLGDVPKEMRPYLPLIDRGVRGRMRRERLLRPTLLVLRRTASLAVSAAIVLIVGALGLTLLLMGADRGRTRPTFSATASRLTTGLFAQLHPSDASPTPSTTVSIRHPLAAMSVEQRIVQITVLDYHKTSSRKVTDLATIKPVLKALSSARFIGQDSNLERRVASQTYIVLLGLSDGSVVSLIYLPGDRGPNVEDPASQNWWTAPGLDPTMQPLLPNPPVASKPASSADGEGGHPVPARTPGVVSTGPTPAPGPISTPGSTPTAVAIVKQLPDPAVSLLAAPGNGRSLFALLVTNALYRSDDGGQTWRHLPLPAAQNAETILPTTSRLSSTYVVPPRSIAIPSASPNRVFVAADRVLYGSDDDGESWRPLEDAVYAWAVGDAAGDVVYVWHGATPSSSSGVYRSSDSGHTWQPVYPGPFPPLLASQHCPCNHEGISALAVDPRDPNVVFAGTDYGVFRSGDGGRTWKDYNDGMPSSVRSYRWTPILTTAPDGTLYALSEVFPRATSSQAALVGRRPGAVSWSILGESALDGWRNANEPLSGFRALVADPATPGRLLLGTSRGLLASDDGGGTWRAVTLSQGKGVYAIATASLPGTSPGGAGSSQVYLWTDAGLVRAAEK